MAKRQKQSGSEEQQLAFAPESSFDGEGATMDETTGAAGDQFANPLSESEAAHDEDNAALIEFMSNVESTLHKFAASVREAKEKKAGILQEAQGTVAKLEQLHQDVRAERARCLDVLRSTVQDAEAEDAQ